MDRSPYLKKILETLKNKTQMIFLMGARQVGKTTLTNQISKHYQKHIYLNWDIDDHRLLILSGQKFIESIFPKEVIGPRPLVIFDELHKMPNWKNFIKGFYDLYKESYDIIVTGSAHLNVFQKGGDSLMGRYIPYTLNPFSVGELSGQDSTDLLRPPSSISAEDIKTLYDFGGFPDPFLSRSVEDYNQWKRLRRTQLFREDIRDLTNIQEISQIELCAQFLIAQSGCIFNRSTLSKKLRVGIQTIDRWSEVLSQFYFSFKVYPFSHNIPHSLIKEPKIYMNDWSIVENHGAKFENFVACHLKKSVEYWNESGKGDFSLNFLRDKNQREVDFIITKDQDPWMLIECKTRDQSVSKPLYYFQEKTKAPFSFQVVKEMPYINQDCFQQEGLFTVPSNTFLSQFI